MFLIVLLYMKLQFLHRKMKIQKNKSIIMTMHLALRFMMKKIGELMMESIMLMRLRGIWSRGRPFRRKTK